MAYRFSFNITFSKLAECGFVTGGEDRIALDSELQKEISIIWPYLPQKTLDLLVPINKGLTLSMEEILNAVLRDTQKTANVVRMPSQIRT